MELDAYAEILEHLQKNLGASMAHYTQWPEPATDRQPNPQNKQESLRRMQSLEKRIEDAWRDEVHLYVEGVLGGTMETRAGADWVDMYWIKEGVKHYILKGHVSSTPWKDALDVLLSGKEFPKPTRYDLLFGGGSE